MKAWVARDDEPNSQRELYLRRPTHDRGAWWPTDIGLLVHDIQDDDLPSIQPGSGECQEIELGDVAGLRDENAKLRHAMRMCPDCHEVLCNLLNESNSGDAADSAK